MKKKSLFLFFCFLSLTKLSAQQFCRAGIKIPINSNYYETININNESFPINFCEGNGLEVVGDVANLDIYKTEWFKDNRLIVDSTRTSLVIKTSGRYYAKFYSNACIYFSPEANYEALKSLPTPFFANTVGSRITDSLVFCGEVDYKGMYGGPTERIYGKEDRIYTWQRNGITSSQYSTEFISNPEPGIYTVKVEQGACASTSEKLKVIQSDKTIKQQLYPGTLTSASNPGLGDTTRICSNTEMIFSIGSIYPRNIQWKLNNVVLAETSEKLRASEPGTYSITFNNINGCNVEAATTLVKADKIMFGKPEVFESVLKGTCASLFIRQNTGIINILSTTIPNFSFSTRQFLVNGELKNEKPFYASEIVPRPLQETSYQYKMNVNGCAIESEPIVFKPSSSKTVFSLVVQDRTVKNKKVELCPGSSVKIAPFTLFFDAVRTNLYKDGVVQQVLFKTNTPFLVDTPGKYHIEVVDENCSQTSDTIEVVMPKPIAQNLRIDYSNCQNVLSIAANDDVTNVAWKLNGQLLEARGNNLVPKQNGNYVAVVNQGSCWFETQSLDFTAATMKTLNFCEGDTLKLKSSAEGSAYAWTGTSGFKAEQEAISIPNLQPDNSGAYALSVKQANCSFVDTTIVKVTPKPQVEFEQFGHPCSGKTFKIQAKAIPSNNYIGNGFYKNANGEESSFYLGQELSSEKFSTGTYTIPITTYGDQNQCTVQKEIVIKPTDNCQIIELGDINCEFYKDSIMTFSPNGVFDKDDTFHLYGITSYGYTTLLAKNEGNKFKIPSRFSIYYYDFYGTKAASFYVVSEKTGIKSSIKELPKVIIQPSMTVAKDFQNNYENECDRPFKISLSAIGTKLSNIQWYKNDILIAQDTTVLTINQSGQYRVSAQREFAAGCSESINLNKYIDLNEQLKLTNQVSWNNIRALCDASIISFGKENLRSQPNEKLTFRWEFNDKDMGIVTDTAALVVTKAGKYAVKVINQKGCTTAYGATYANSIGLKKGILLSQDGNGISFIYPGNKLTLYSEYSNSIRYDANFKKPYDVIEWQKDGKPIESPTGSNEYELDVPEVGTYRYRAIKGECILYSNEVVVKAFETNNKPIILLDKTKTEACVKEEVKLRISYESRYVPYDIKRILVYKNGEYLRDAKSQTWDLGVILKTSGSYQIKIQTNKNEEFWSDELNIKFDKTLETISLIEKNIIHSCINDVVISNPYADEDLNFTWKRGNEKIATSKNLIVKESGIYQLETERNGCKVVSNPVEVKMNTISPKIYRYNQIFCENDLQGLYVNLENQNYSYQQSYTYEWKVNDVIKSNNSEFFITEGGKYELKVSSGGCVGTTSEVIEPIKIPNVVLSFPNGYTACPGTPIDLATASGADRYEWFFNTQTTNFNTANIQTTQRGKYTALVEKSGCSRQTQVVTTINRADKPAAVLTGRDLITAGSSSELKILLKGEAPWLVKTTDNQTFNIKKSPFNFNVRPKASTTYALASVQNNCGVGQVGGQAKVTVMGVSTGVESTNVMVNTWPNPATNSFELSVQQQAEPQAVEYTLLSSTEKVISAGKFETVSAEAKQQINLDYLPNGTYLLRVKVGNEVITKRIVKIE